MSYNAFFGVKFTNHLTQEQDAQQTYLDIDLDLSRVTDKIFLVIHDQRLYLTAGGLSFVDIIYASEFIVGKFEWFYIEFDQTYTSPSSKHDEYRYERLSSEKIPEALLNQLRVIRDSLSVDSEEIEKSIAETGASSKIDINSRLFYEIVYEAGSVCQVTNKPRRTRVHFYCDQYQEEKDQALTVLDISEPDYCEYLFKVSTKFMCAAGTQFKKASAKLHEENQQRPDLNLDATQHTKRQKLQCTIKSEF